MGGLGSGFSAVWQNSHQDRWLLLQGLFFSAPLPRAGMSRSPVCSLLSFGSSKPLQPTAQLRCSHVHIPCALLRSSQLSWPLPNQGLLFLLPTAGRNWLVMLLASLVLFSVKYSDVASPAVLWHGLAHSQGVFIFTGHQVFV